MCICMRKYIYIYIYMYIHIYIYIMEVFARGTTIAWMGDQGFQGYGSSILRIRYIVPRMLFVFVCFYLFSDSSNRGVS